jgi:hypothetical protein
MDKRPITAQKTADSPGKMPQRSWQEMHAWIVDELKRRTGDDVSTWNTRVLAQGLDDEAALRAWLTDQGVTGYPAMLLVRERFGYPDYLTATADDLVAGQYRDRPALRPILDAILVHAADIGDVEVQTRKGYVTLLSPKRTFASIEPTTKKRVNLGLRIDAPVFDGRLRPPVGIGQSSMTSKIGLASVDDVDDEIDGWLRRAYAENT